MGRQLLFVLDKRQKRNLFLIFVMILVGSGVELASVAGISPIVTIISDESVLKTNEKYQLLGRLFHLTDSRQYVLFLSICLIFIYIFKNLYVIFEKQVQCRFTYNNQRRLAGKLLTYYVNKDYIFHTSTNVADLQRNVDSDVLQFWNVVSWVLQFLMESLVCVALFVYLMISDWQSTLAILLLLSFFVGVNIFVLNRYSSALGVQVRTLRALMTKHLLQVFGGIKEIKVANKEAFFINSYDHAFEQYCTIQRKQSVATDLPKPIMETVCVCGLLLVMAIRIALGTDMKEFVPILAVFVVAAYRMMPSFNRITAYYGHIMYGRASVKNVYLDIQKMKQKEEEQNREDTDQYEFRLNTDIELRNITFSYPQSEECVLKNIFMTIPRKKSVALIGPSGAGKSTLADLVLGVLIPDCGEIIADGVNVYDHIKSWHKVIGYIPQVIYLLDDTIRNNVAFGLSAEEIDDEIVWRALKDAQLDDFVRTLPQGLDTEVGDRGVRLSGGQRQRIGIARALYSDPELLILDEATSALDTETETAVMEAIDGLHGTRTMMIIAHRLTTIKNCDFVYEIAGKSASLKDKQEIMQK